MRRCQLGSTLIKPVIPAVVVQCILILIIAGFSTVAGSLAMRASFGRVALFVWLVLGYFVFLPRQARKIYAQQKTMQYPVETFWNSETYSAATAVATGTIPWVEYHDKTMILLMQSPVLFQMPPRHALSPEQLTDLTDHIKRSGLRNI